MKIPKTIKIGAYDIAVEPLDHRECISEQSYGMFCMSEEKIKLDFEVPPMKVLSTLLHEINHAIFDISATRKLEAWPEEFIVSTMANMWTQVYRDNPELLEYIREVVG